MKIGAIRNIGGQDFSAFAANVNRSVARQVGKEPRTDTVTLSPAARKGQKGGALQSMMEQRQSLLDQKKNLLAKAKETGVSVKDQVKSLNDQLDQLDAQITGQMIQDATQLANKEEKKEQTEPMTEEELRKKQQADAMELATDYSTAKTISSVKTKVEGQANILRAEIKMDGFQAGEEGTTNSGKQVKLAQLEATANNLTSRIGSLSMDQTQQVKENAEEAAAKAEEKQDEQEKQEEQAQQTQAPQPE